jgi:hypothetical protein
MSETMTVQTFSMRCPCCKRADSLDIEVMVWVRLTHSGTSVGLNDDAAPELDGMSAARCSACGWGGRAEEALPQKETSGAKARGTGRCDTSFPPAMFCCPAGHSEGLQESHQLHVWFPVDAATGDADYTIPLSDLGPSDIDEEAVSDCYFFGPTCNDTFSELADITTTSKRNRSP